VEYILVNSIVVKIAPKNKQAYIPPEDGPPIRAETCSGYEIVIKTFRKKYCCVWRHPQRLLAIDAEGCKN
jgi:hypothetical protein